MTIESTTLDCGTFTVGRIQSARAEAFPPHVHDRAYLHLVLDGCLLEISSNGEETLRPDELQFRPRAFAHDAYLSGPFSALVVEFKVAAAPLICSLFEVTSSFRLPRNVLDDIPHRLWDEFPRNDPASRYMMEALIVQGLATVARALPARMTDRPLWFERATSLISSNLGTRLSVSAIARSAGVSASTLNTAFHSLAGLSVCAYVRKQRLDRAAEALLDTGTTIRDIAVGHGFADQAHFCRRFKEAFGTTPLTYRQRFRGGV